MGGGGSGFISGRRSRSASPSTQQEKHPTHHERGQKKVEAPPSPVVTPTWGLRDSQTWLKKPS